jgi:hypothetical protein
LADALKPRETDPATKNNIEAYYILRCDVV